MPRHAPHRWKDVSDFHHTPWNDVTVIEQKKKISREVKSTTEAQAQSPFIGIRGWDVVCLGCCWMTHVVWKPSSTSNLQWSYPRRPVTMTRMPGVVGHIVCTIMDPFFEIMMLLHLKLKGQTAKNNLDATTLRA